MEDSSRYCYDQTGNTDYSQLHRWSPSINAGYKSPAPNDNSNYIYTSDYGSYSSQESNHSGTTYSNLADCEEALYSTTGEAYDLPPPELFNSMERRRDKPLPPPRLTSRTPVPQRIQAPVAPPVRQKKISFDDSTMTKKFDVNGDVSEIPSFATLPRKKKLVNGGVINNAPVQSTTQVTWMKEVAQKGGSMTKSKSSGAIDPNKKPQGILKNKLPATKSKSDTNGYIKRDTVQRILDQQRKALNRQSAAPSQYYKSLPNLRPTTSGDRLQQQKAWEYNYQDRNASTTATVIGVFEPHTEERGNEVNHTKQGSNETEFEFPPPPSDHDIAQIMRETENPVQSGTKIPNNDFTPLTTACDHNTLPTPRGRPPVRSKPVLSRSHSQSERDYRQRPQVPQRPQTAQRNNNNSTSNIEVKEKGPAPKPKVRPRGKSVDRMTTERRKVYDTYVQPPQPTIQSKKIVPPPRMPKPQMTKSTTHQRIQKPQDKSNYQCAESTTDIVLPPPLEFQEPTSVLATDKPSYGDYELLSPEAQYERCVLHPTLPRNSQADSNLTYNQMRYHQNLHSSNSDSSTNSSVNSPGNGYKQADRYNGHSPNDLNMYKHNPNYARTLINHRHQYSTEL